MGQALRLEVILLSKEKAAAPRPKPRGRPRGRSCGRPRGRCRRGRPRGTGRQTLQNLPNLNPLQNPPNTFPNRHPRAKATSQSGPPGPRPQQWLSIGFQSCRLPACKHSKRSKTLQTLQNPPNTIQNPPNPPGLEACFEQVAQGLWLVRRVHRRSKAISLPGRLELPTLRLTASRSNQLSYGSLCRRPKLVPVLEKRLNNGWLQMVCQTKGQQPK